MSKARTNKLKEETLVIFFLGGDVFGRHTLCGHRGDPSEHDVDARRLRGAPTTRQGPSESRASQASVVDASPDTLSCGQWERQERHSHPLLDIFRAHSAALMQHLVLEDEDELFAGAESCTNGEQLSKCKLTPRSWRCF